MNDELEDQLIIDEGKKNQPYWDCCGRSLRSPCAGGPGVTIAEANLRLINHTGILTIGVGHNLEAGISDDVILYMLREDISLAKGSCRTFFRWIDNLTSTRQNVLFNMCFNMGIGRLLDFVKMLRYLEIGDYELAASEMENSAWYREVGSRAKRLTQIIRDRVK